MKSACAADAAAPILALEDARISFFLRAGEANVIPGLSFVIRPHEVWVPKTRSDLRGRSNQRIVSSSPWMLDQGRTVAEICRELGVTELTYFRWRKQ